MITVEQAAKCYGVSIQTIRNWANKKMITFSYLGSKLMIDEESLGEHIELNAQLSRYNEQLEEYVQLKQKELASVVEGITDLLFLFRSIKEISPILHMVVNELSMLIPDKLKRLVFVEVTLSKKISTVAGKFSLTVEETQVMYKETLAFLQKEAGFIDKYRKSIAKKDIEIRELQILNKNLKTKIEDLICTPDLKEAYIEPYSIIPGDYVKLLSLHLEKDLNIDTRIINCLKAINIETVEDLLRHVRLDGFQKLKDCKNFGNKCLRDLKAKLLVHNIINSDETSYLFAFLD